MYSISESLGLAVFKTKRLFKEFWKQFEGVKAWQEWIYKFYKELKPSEFGNAVTAIRSCRGRLKLVEVSNTLDVFKNAIDPKSILTASLCSDFFELKAPKNKNDLTKLINFLTKDNNHRIFEILENHFFAKDFESALERLDEITDLLESGEAKLEDSLSLYTEGLEIARYCTSQLNEAEKKIKLIADKNGLPVETDFDEENED